MRCEAGTFVSSAGIPLRFLREGDGPPLLIIGSSEYYSRSFTWNLRHHFHLAFTDLRHFAPAYEPSTEDLARTTLDTFIEEVEEIRAAMRLERMVLLGHSAHAQIALAYAATHGSRLSGLVLVCGVPCRFDEMAALQQQYFEQHASSERKAILQERLATFAEEMGSVPSSRAFAVQYHANAPLYWANPVFDDQANLACLETSPAFGALFASLPAKAVVRKRLESITIPTLVVTGRLDFACPCVAWDELVVGLPHVTVSCIAESGHNPHREHPQLFDPLLVEWVQKTCGEALGR